MKQIAITVSALAFGGVGFALYQGLRKLTREELRSKILKQIIKCYNESAKNQFVEPFQVEQTFCKNEQGIEFHIKLVKTLQKKPTNNPPNIDPLIKPFQPGQFVMELKNYSLLLNKYPVNPYHTLLVPNEFVHQTAPFTKDYLSYAYDTLVALKGFAFFNSHPEAGASLQHKHLQIVPQSALQSANILNHISNWYYESTIKDSSHFIKLRYLKRVKHFILFFNEKIYDPQITDEEQEQILYTTYIRLIQKCGVDLNNLTQLKHNLIITTEFMMIVVRKQGSYNNISLNAVGFTGSLLAKNQEELEKLKQTEIQEVLSNLAELDDTVYEQMLIC